MHLILIKENLSSIGKGSGKMREPSGEMLVGGRWTGTDVKKKRTHGSTHHPVTRNHQQQKKPIMLFFFYLEVALSLSESWHISVISPSQ